MLVANGDTIVSSIQVGRFQGTGSDNIGWATSKDAGRNWRHGFLSGITVVAGGPWPAVSLPTVAFDQKHRTYLIASMPFDDQGDGRGIVVNRSLDGLHWGQPVIAASSLGTNGHWIGCDNTPTSPYYGNCYDAYLDYSSGSFLNALVSSNNGGLSWSDPVISPDHCVWYFAKRNDDCSTVAFAVHALPLHNSSATRAWASLDDYKNGIGWQWL